MIKVHFGFDDIDTPMGGCTTHFTALLLSKWIRERRVRLFDYPNLIRLSPGVPWKTRGNGTLVLRLLVDGLDEALDMFEEAVAEAYKYLEEYRHPESQPALLLYIGELDPRVEWLGRKAVNDIVPLSLLDRVLLRVEDRVYYKALIHGRRGLIGSLAGIGYRMTNTDYTYELIAYRSSDYVGRPRMVDPESVRKMDAETRPNTILNYDYEIGKPLITPHGPDPVLLGIRGENREAVVNAYEKLVINEPVPLRVVFRTNQHTDAHLARTTVSNAFIYRGVIIRGRVSKNPRRIRGGHVVLSIRDETGEIDAAAYEPTGGFRRVVEELKIGDVVEVYGVVRPQSRRHGPTINIEKIKIIMVKPLIKTVNPVCPRCGARMKSMGRGKGYKCPKCGYRDRHAHKIVYYVQRRLEPGFYQPPPRSFKHLMKPIERIGREKNQFPEIYEPREFIWLNERVLR